MSLVSLRKAALSLLAPLAIVALSVTAYSAPQGSQIDWDLHGNITEACTCAPPCSCSFAGGSAPHNFCFFIFSIEIKEGHYGTLNLEGMHLAGGVASKGLVWYTDDTATPEQTNALHKIAEHITETVYKVDGIKPSELPLKGFRRAKIEQVADGKRCSLRIGEAGKFESSYITGMDGKTPVTVENNWSWNMTHCMKAKTSSLKYKDSFGNHIIQSGSNASSGQFEWDSSTRIYFR